MNQPAGIVERPGIFVPLRLDERSLAVKIAAVAIGTLFLAVSSRIQVPMVPVPVTMQTLAVTLVGALMGWRLAGITILAWFAEAAVGMPVLASGGGLAYFAGPTGGYLFGFLVGAMAVGWCAEKGWTRGNAIVSFAVMLAANALILATGGVYLAYLIGVEPAIASGVTPFLIGAVLKSALAVAMIEAMFKVARKSPGA